MEAMLAAFAGLSLEGKKAAVHLATVFAATHRNGSRAALKVMHMEFARDSQIRERFLREARAANRIDHEHIIDITDFGETDDGLVYLVMEYIDGAPLDAFCRDNGLKEVWASPFEFRRHGQSGLEISSLLDRKSVV